MNKIFMALVAALCSGAIKGFSPNGQNSMEIARLKMSLIYVKSVDTFRWLFISLLGIGACLIFLMSSLIVLHTTLFLYIPWSIEAKMYVSFSLAGIYFLIAVIISSYIFSHAQWMKIFNADKIISNLTKPSGSQDAPENPRRNGVHENNNKEDLAEKY